VQNPPTIRFDRGSGKTSAFALNLSATTTATVTKPTATTATAIISELIATAALNLMVT